MARGEVVRSDDRRVKHGEQRTPLWNIWVAFRSRIRRTTPAPTYQGLDCDPDWDDYVTFRDWAHAHGYRVGLTIDRIDNKRGYWPDNCRWATYEQQNLNKTITRRILRSDGIVFGSIKEAAASVGQRYSGNVSSCCSGRIRSAYGYGWRYL